MQITEACWSSGVTLGVEVQENLVNINVEFSCFSPYDKFVLSGEYANGTQILWTSSCTKTNVPLYDSLTIPRTESLLYDIAFKPRDRYDSYIAIYDEYNSMVLKFQVAVIQPQQIIHFSLEKPITKDSQIVYTEQSVPEIWYKEDYPATEFSSIQQNSTVENMQAIQYYRKTFSISDLSIYAAFSLFMAFNGNITIYINDQFIWKGYILTFPMYYLKKSNLLSICVESPASSSSFSTPSSIIDLYMTLYYANEENQKCASTINKYDVTSSPTEKTASNLFDYLLYTWYHSDATVNNSVTIIFPKNEYININAYRFYTFIYYNEQPESWTIEGSTDESNDFSLLSKMIHYSVVSYYRFYNLYANSNALKQIKFTNLKIASSTTKTSLQDIHYLTCSIPSPLSTSSSIYPSSPSFLYTFTKDIPITTIKPIIYGYSQFTTNPELLPGISIDPLNGYISGTPTQLQSASVYSIIASSPFHYEVQLTLSVSECQGSRLILDRYQRLSASKQNTESAILYNKNNDIIYEQQPYIDFASIYGVRYHLCAATGLFTLNLSPHNLSSSNYDTDSYILIHYAPQPIQPLDTKDINYSQYILLGKYHYNEKENYIFTFDTSFILPYGSSFHSLYGSIPEGWYSESFDDSRWNNVILNDSPTPSSINLYRTSITLTTVSLYGSYEFFFYTMTGTILYINGNEVWRNKVNDTITVDSTSTSDYSSIIYRRITISSRYFKSGSNIIAVLHTPPKSLNTTNYFQILLRVIETSTRDAITSYNADYKEAGYYDHDYDTAVSKSYPDQNTISILSKNDEFSTLTGYSLIADIYSTSDIPRSWVFMGRYNYEGRSTSSLWEVIHNMTYYSLLSSPKRYIYLIPVSERRLYNEYQFIDITNYGQSSYNLKEIELFVENPMERQVELTYDKTGVTGYVGVYIQKLSPYTTIYKHYSSLPPLPEGISINPNTGIITGLPAVDAPTTNYTITALSYDGSTVSTIVTITIYNCPKGSNLLSMIFYYYFDKHDINIAIDMAHGTSGIHENSINDFYKDTYLPPNKELILSRLYSFCNDDTNILLKLVAGFRDRYDYPFGYTMYYPSSYVVKSAPITSTESIYSEDIEVIQPVNTPKSILYYKTTDSIQEDWLNLKDNLTTWTIANDNIIQGNKKRIIYIRSIFSLESLESHSSIDFILTTSGSPSVYINKQLVYTSEEHINRKHTFTFILQGKPIRTQNNSIGIQLLFENPQEEVLIDIHSHYSTDICASYINSFSYSIKESFVASPLLDSIFDRDYYTYSSLSNPDIYVAFTEEQGLYINSIHLTTGTQKPPETITIYGKPTIDGEWMLLLDNYKIEISNSKDIYIPFYAGILQFPYYHLLFNSELSSSYSISDLSFSYCPYSYSFCDSIDGYPPVAEHAYSYIHCGNGFTGFSYRYCDGLYFDVEKRENCHYLKPTDFKYSKDTYVLYTYNTIQDITPTYNNIVSSFSIDRDLPSGIQFDTITGTISGFPLEVFTKTLEYTITAKNPEYTTTTTLYLRILPGRCEAIDIYPATNISESVILPCGNGYIGTKSKTCFVNEENRIIWDKTEERCISIFLIVFLPLSVILILIVIAILVIHKHTDAKRKIEIANLRRITAPQIIKQSA
ncbi:hypothetical protein WA158_002186 [Blastocystis sp. Blastoise]